MGWPQVECEVQILEEVFILRVVNPEERRRAVRESWQEVSAEEQGVPPFVMGHHRQPMTKYYSCTFVDTAEFARARDMWIADELLKYRLATRIKSIGHKNSQF